MRPKSEGFVRKKEARKRAKPTVDPYANLGFKGKKKQQAANEALRTERKQQTAAAHPTQPGVQKYLPKVKKKKAARQELPLPGQTKAEKRIMALQVFDRRKTRLGVNTGAPQPDTYYRQYQMHKEALKRRDAALLSNASNGSPAIPLAMGQAGTKLGNTLAAISKTSGQVSQEKYNKAHPKGDGEGLDAAADAMTKVLDQLSRPYYGVNAAAKAGVRGENPAAAAVRGAALKERTDSWDVLDAAGVKNKYIKYGVGVPLSFASDPTTYASLALAPESGGSSLAALGPKGAKIAKLLNQGSKGAAAVDKLIKAGKVAHGPVTAAQAEKLASRGVQAGVKARLPFSQKAVNLHTSGRATRALGRTKAAKKVRENSAVRGTREAFTTTARPAPISHAENEGLTTAEREQRAAQHQAAFERKQTEKEITQAIRRSLGMSKVKAKTKSGKQAIAREDVRLRSEIERVGPKTKVASYLEDLYADILKTERGEGLKTPKFEARGADDAQGYAPRYQAHEVQKKPHKQHKKDMELAGVKPPTTSRINPEQPQQRKVRQPQDTVAPTGKPTDYSRTIIGDTAKRRSDSILNIGRKRYNEALANVGRKVKPGDFDPADLPASDAVFVHNPTRPHEGFKEISPTDAERFRKGEGTTGYEFVVVKRKVIEDSKNRIAEADKMPRSKAGGAADRALGRWKGLVTVMSPSYYGRNAIGDLTLAHQADTDVRSLAQSARIARATHKKNRIVRSGKRVTEGKDPEAALKKLKVKINGKTYSGKELEDMATETGAIGGGTIGGEVSQLVGSESYSVNNPLSRANVSRENHPRRATFLAAMKRGDNPKQAAAYSNKHHYDYGDLTHVEKSIRRVVPFYTFWSKNTRKQLTQLVTRPGKTTQIYHVMNAAADAAGFDGYRDYLQNLPEAQQRGLPIPVKVNGKIKNIQFGNVLSDLQALTPNYESQLWNAGGRVHPLKSAIEIPANFSTFYRDAIAPEHNPDTRAPDFLKSLPPGIRNKLHLTTKLDRKTGEEYTGYNKRLDYALRQLGPQANLLLSMLTKKSSGPFEQSQTDALIGLTGLRPNTFYKDQSEINALYKKRSELMNKKSGFSGRTDVGDERKQAVNDRIKKISDEIAAKEKAAGYKAPLGSNKKKSGSGFFDGAKEEKSGFFDKGPVKKSGFFDDVKTTSSSAPKTRRVRTVANTNTRSTPAVSTSSPAPRTRTVSQVTTSSSSSGSGSSGGRTAAQSPVTTKQSAKGVAAKALRKADSMNATTREKEALIAAGLVESNLTNMSGGDRDSEGFLQQRPSQGWGTSAQVRDIDYATKKFIDTFRAFEKQGKITKGMTVGQAVQAVQRSAFPERYDQRLKEARKIIAGISTASTDTSTAAGTKSSAASKPIATSANRMAIAAYLQSPKKKGAILELAAALKSPAESVAPTTKGSKKASAASDGSGGSNPWRAALNAGAQVSSGHRPGAITSSGNVSDHSQSQPGQMARDFVGKDMDKIARDIAKTLGLKNYKGGLVNVNKGGYRYQLIWQAAGHYDHVHLGRKKI